MLMKIAVDYHRACSHRLTAHDSSVRCKHGPAVIRTVTKENKNKGNSLIFIQIHIAGKRFYACPEKGKQKCDFFQWVDESKVKSANRNPNYQFSPADISYIRSQGIKFYAGCELSN